MRRVLIPLLIVLGSITLYYLMMVGFGIYQRFPVLHIAACVAGTFWLMVVFGRKRTIGHGAAVMFALTLTAGYVWYTLDYSSYKPRVAEVTEGQTVGGLTSLRLLDHDGIERAVLDPGDDRATLLVLYRGYW